MLAMEDHHILHTPEDAARILIPLIGGLASEEAWLLCLGPDLSLLSVTKIAEGGADGVTIRPRDVVYAALHASASFVVVAHNHPSGAGEPSGQDKAAASVLNDLLPRVGIRVLANLVIAGNTATDIRTGRKMA